MHRIYSTNNLSDAKRLENFLKSANVMVHISGINTHALRIPGVSTLHDAIGVWVLHTEEVQIASEVMRREGFLVVAPSSSTTASPRKWWHAVIWFIIPLTIVILLGVGR